MTEDAEEGVEYRDVVAFVGPCTCDHEEEQRGWGHCDVDDCLCEAGWEE